MSFLLTLGFLVLWVLMLICLFVSVVAMTMLVNCLVICIYDQLVHPYFYLEDWLWSIGGLIFFIFTTIGLSYLMIRSGYSILSCSPCLLFCGYIGSLTITHNVKQMPELLKDIFSHIRAH